MQYSSFTKRFFAMLIDLVVINVGVMIAGELFLDSAALGAIIEQNETGQMMNAAQLQTLMQAALVLGIASIIMVLLIDAVLPATKLMASPGKHVMGMVMTDMEGKRLGLGRSIGRHAAKFVSFVTLVGFLLPLWTQKKQALHDMMCGTLVVRKKGLLSR